MSRPNPNSNPNPNPYQSPLADDVDLDALAERTDGFSGADITEVTPPPPPTQPNPNPSLSPSS